MTVRVLPSTASPVLPTPRITVQLAEPGSGKTFQARRIAFLWPRVLYLDSQTVGGVSEYPGIVAHDPLELGDVLFRLSSARRWRVSYRGDVSDDLLRAVAELHRVLIVVEEADKYCDAGVTPAGLYTIAHHGRRAGTGLVLNARRAANISRDLTATADCVRVWAQSEPVDRDAVRKRGFPLAVLDALPRHAYAQRARDVSGALAWTVETPDGRSVPFAPTEI